MHLSHNCLTGNLVILDVTFKSLRYIFNHPTGIHSFMVIFMSFSDDLRILRAGFSMEKCDVTCQNKTNVVKKRC